MRRSSWNSPVERSCSTSRSPACMSPTRSPSGRPTRLRRCTRRPAGGSPWRSGHRGMRSSRRACCASMPARMARSRYERLGGHATRRRPLNPTWCLPAAFFDSLIAQQDRHDGNWRWDGERLTLIDHGYAFALPRAILNYSDFVVARHRHGAASLLAEEHDVLSSPAQRLRPARNGAVPVARPRAGAGGQGAVDAPTRRGSAPWRVLRCPPCVPQVVVAS